MERIYKQSKVEKKELDKAIEQMLIDEKCFGVSQEDLIGISNKIQSTMEKIHEQWNTNN